MENNIMDSFRNLTGKMKTDIISKKWFPYAVGVVAGVLLALIFIPATKVSHEHEVAQQKENQIEFWTCSMHPQIKAPGPGKCPICGMDLIPVTKKKGQGNPRQLTLSETAKKLAEITTSPVERKFVTHTVRMVGKIDYDETRMAYITAWVSGRLDRMFVDYTGVPVKKGDHMVEIYSPELISAQEEYLLALRSVRESEGRRVSMNKRMLEATREKLLLWGLTKEQLKTIEKRGKPSDHTTIYAPVGGIVIQKNALEGSYVETGTKIYAIADLNHLWVRLDAYESDLMWVRYGQEVEFTTEAYPGEGVKGRISFIDPVLNDQTRTVKVRANVENPAGRLKPQMFVKALVKAKVARGGKVMDADLAGKWIGPMHPEIIRDKPGNCPICGMPLVKVETYGFVSADVGKEAPLVIPASAPLLTGTRAIVYVEIPGTEEPTYEGREIVLGPRAGDYYLVKSGLSEGERVVTKGNFKIDSALQILAKPSMMNPEGGGPAPGHAHHGSTMKMPETSQQDKSIDEKHQQHRIEQEKTLENIPLMFRQQLSEVALAYLKLSEALVRGDVDSAKSASTGIKQALGKVDMSLLKGEAHMEWMKNLQELNGVVNKIIETGNIQEQRKAYALLSESLASTLKRFGNSLGKPLRVFRCPMAFDGRGAEWLQVSEDVQNPYFGAAMLKCGSQTAVIESGN